MNSLQLPQLTSDEFYRRVESLGRRAFRLDEQVRVLDFEDGKLSSWDGKVIGGQYLDIGDYTTIPAVFYEVVDSFGKVCKRRDDSITRMSE